MEKRYDDPQITREAELTGKRWDFCAEGYSDIIQQEFSEVGDAWVRVLSDNAPDTGKKALDIGTGPGFFAMVLAMQGFDATGIDCSERMLETARKNADARGLNVDFQFMDSHALTFGDNTFDYIVARNATWLLYDPEKAFSEWLRVLRPGGRLMYIDANWPYVDDPELTRRMKEANDRFEKARGKAFNTYTGTQATNDAFNRLVVFDHILRPEWDVKTLPKLGYCRIKVDPRINERVYPPWKRELYDAMDTFLITAEKPTPGEGIR